MCAPAWRSRKKSHPPGLRGSDPGLTLAPPGTADDGWIEYSARFVGHGVLDVIKQMETIFNRLYEKCKNKWPRKSL